MKNIYLFAAIAGALIPYLFFVDFFLAEGLAPLTFLLGIFANGAAGGFAADVLISSAVFWHYLFYKKEPRVWIYVLLNLTIGLSCALPYYLYVKSKEAESNLEQQIPAIG
jgi:hypothetical protein